LKDRFAKIAGVENSSGTTQHESSLRPVSKTGKTSFNNVLETSFKEINSKPVAFKKTLFRNDIPPVINFQTQTVDSGFKSSLAMVLKHEGKGYVKNDAMKGPSRMGILQSTAREYGYYGNVKNITPAQTEAIYKKIWDKSGASNLPYPLSAIHFDTFVNSPAAAKKILKQSGGDVDTYLSLRADRYSKLASVRPERYAKYLKGWMNRISSLRDMATTYAKATESTTNKIA
jgi:lysozyme family protein